MAEMFGYAGKILRVNLSTGEIREEPFEDGARRTLIGGTGFGGKVLYDEVPPGVAWNDPENRLVVGTLEAQWNEKLCALVSPDGHSPQRHHIACSTRVHSAATGWDRN